MKGKLARSTREMPSAISILLLGVAYFKGEGFPTSLGWQVCGGGGEHNAGARPEEGMEPCVLVHLIIYQVFLLHVTREWLGGTGHRSLTRFNPGCALSPQLSCEDYISTSLYNTGCLILTETLSCSKDSTCAQDNASSFLPTLF